MASSSSIPTAVFETSNDTRIAKQDDNDIPKQEPESSIPPLAKEKSKLDPDLKMPSDAVDDDAKREARINNKQVYDLDYHFNRGQINPHDLKSYHKDKDYLYHTRRAIKKYNNENKEDASIKLVKIVKVNLEFASNFTYYITFEAKDASGQIRTYQAVVCEHIPREKSVTDLVRLKPDCN